jgi:uncharacterized membrane protein
MADKKFKITDALNYGWDAVMKNLNLFISILVITGILAYVLPYLADKFIRPLVPELAYALINVVIAVLNVIISIGLLKISLKIYDNQKATLNDLLNSTQSFFNFLGGMVLYGLIVVAGMFLLIVPGIIWAVKYFLTPYLIIDKNLNPLQALKNSGRMTHGSKLDLFLFSLLSFVLLALGGSLVLNGFSVLSPVVTMATAYIYKKLSDQAAAIPAPAIVTPGPVIK